MSKKLQHNRPAQSAGQSQYDRMQVRQAPNITSTTSQKLNVSRLVLQLSLQQISDVSTTLQWRHNGRDCVSNHQPHDWLLNRLFRRRSQKTSKPRVTGLCAGNSPVTGEFPAQMVSNAENIAIWWRHHDQAYHLYQNQSGETLDLFLTVLQLQKNSKIHRTIRPVPFLGYRIHTICTKNQSWRKRIKIRTNSKFLIKARFWMFCQGAFSYQISRI